jgi:uncharacterized protein
MNKIEINRYFLNFFNEDYSLEYVNDFYEYNKDLIDINCVNTVGETPFLLAAKNNKKELLAWLLEKNANLDNRAKIINFNALMLAILVNAQNSIDFLIEKNIGLNDVAKKGETCLDIAISEGTVESAKKLIDAGLFLDVNDEKYLKKAVDNYFSSKSIDMIKFLIEKEIKIDNHYLKTNLLDNLYDELMEYQLAIKEKKLLDNKVKQNTKKNIKTLKV